jgi:putative membrane protein
MTTTQGDLASLSRYIFRAPSWYRSLTLALALAALTGIAAFDSSYPLEDAWQGVFFIGLPTVAAAAMTPFIDRSLGGQLTPNRASLLALSCELLVIGVLTIAGGIAIATSIGQEFVFQALLMALAAIFALRLLVVMAVSRQTPLVAAIPASVQTVAGAVLLFVSSGTMRYFGLREGPIVDDVLSREEAAPSALQQAVQPEDFVLLAVMCILYAGAVWGFLLVIDQPWRRSLGVSVLDFIQGFIGHIAEGTNELEQFFEEIGEEALVPVTVLSFRRPGGEEKARFVLPMIHPGPMGDIGGGNLPVRVAEEADGLAFPPHATAGHDFNLVTRQEVETICATAERAYQRIEYAETASRAERVTEGDATLTGQAFGDHGLVVNTFSPTFADDVEYAVGLSAAAEARQDGLDDVLLVDAHNCNNGLEGEDLGHIVPGSHRSFDMIHGAGNLGNRLAGMAQHPLELGVAWDRGPWSPEEGIGPLGVRVAVTAVDGQRTAWILLDGNNMEPGLREALLERVEGVDVAEVMTSDTHVVNTVEAENQIGDKIDHEELISLVEDLVARAIDDLEPVEGGMASEQAEVTVFGNDRTETLASHANATVQMGVALAAAFIFSVLSLTMLLFFLT